MTLPQYILLAGHGGSGTKRACGILDLSAQTHCRQVPYRIGGSVFQRLFNDGGARWGRPGESSPLMEELWDDAVQQSRSRFSRMDWMPPPPKSHLYQLPRHLQLWRLVKNNNVRAIFSRLQPALRGEEWMMPRWLGDRKTLERAVVVLKLNKVPGWVAWVLSQRPDVAVIHVVRHPGAYLNAWKGRWLSISNGNDLAKENRRRLRQISAVDPEWVDRFPDLGRCSAEQGELWFWRYCCHRIHQVGESCSRYLLFKDEDVINDPLAAARRIYDATGLAFTEDIEQRISAKTGEWRAHTAPWTQLLGPEDTALVREVLQGSPMQDWWSSEQIVSDFSYNFVA